MDRRIVLYMKLGLTAVFWGGTFVAGRVAAQDMPPFSAAFLRFLVASILLVAVLRRRHRRMPVPTLSQLVVVGLLGMTGVFAYNVFFFSGLKTVTASRGALIIATNPVFIALGASVFLHEHLRLGKVVGILLCVTGAVIVISRGRPLDLMGGAIGWGELYMFGCVASWVAYSLVGHVAMKDLSPLVSVTYACVIGTIGLCMPALMESLGPRIADFSMAAWLSVVYLGVFGTVLGFIWYYEGIKVLGPSKAGVFINLVPVSAIVLAFLILGESLDFSLALGGVLVVGGIYLTNRRATGSHVSPTID